MNSQLFFTSSVRKIELQAQSLLPGRTLMQRAGLVAAHFIIKHVPSLSQRILILAGPGNNGGDGFEAALHLRRAGYHVQIAFCGDVTRLPVDASGALTAWLEDGGDFVTEWPETAQSWDVIVDALFGIGLHRPITGFAAEWIQKANSQPALRIALDIPSGLSADTGAMLDEKGDVFCAHHTLTFIGDKPGLHTAYGLDYAGCISVDTLEIDLSSYVADGGLNSPGQFIAQLPKRKRNSHKGLFGNLLVVGGYQGMLGALLLAARTGLYSGSGRVYALSLAEPALQIDFVQPEIMLRAASQLEDVAASSIIVGPGLGQANISMGIFQRVIERNLPLLLDADALNILAVRQDLNEHIKQYAFPCVLTPHPLEAARLLGMTTREVQSNRIQIAQKLAVDYNAVVVLKGAGSVIARPDGRWLINPTGCSALASAGTGDVLSGLIGGFLAQGVPAWEATLAGVWIHGYAAQCLSEELDGEVGITASEVAVASRKVLNQLLTDFTHHE